MRPTQRKKADSLPTPVGRFYPILHQHGPDDSLHKDKWRRRE